MNQAIYVKFACYKYNYGEIRCYLMLLNCFGLMQLTL